MSGLRFYATLRAQALRLIKTGAMSKAGRPPNDPEVAGFNQYARAFSSAVAALESANRREWKQAVGVLNQDVLTSRSEHACARASTRRFRYGPQGLPEHLRQRQAQAVVEKLQRHLAIRAVLNGQTRTLKAKEVARLLAAVHPRLPQVALDTIRKDLAEIRRSSHTRKF